MHLDHHQPDYGTSQKSLGIYIFGFIACIALTLIAFYVVMHPTLPKHLILAVVFGSAIIQFIVQVICFLGLNIKTLQGKVNIGALLYTVMILGLIIFGSLWIMYNLNYFMMN